MKNRTFLLASLLTAAALPLSSASAQQVSTQAVGYTTWTINSGTGTARTFTMLALPLYEPASDVDGATSGVIDSVSSDTVTVNNANWTSGALSNEDAPFCLRVTSGVAEGRNLLVSTNVDNSTDTLTINLPESQVNDLTSLGINEGSDTFELVECDTLGALFPPPSEGGIIGGTSADEADQIWLFVGGTLEKFYFDTGLGYWTQEVTRGSQPDSSSQPIHPDAGILFSRKAAPDSPTELTVTGTVPDSKRHVTVNAAGLTLLGSSWPVDMTLAETGISSIDGWQNGTETSSSGADVVMIFSDGTRNEYYHDGTNWRRVSVRNPAISDGVTVSSGSAVVISKNVPHSSDVVLTQDVPYSL